MLQQDSGMVHHKVLTRTQSRTCGLAEETSRCLVELHRFCVEQRLKIQPEDELDEVDGYQKDLIVV